MKPMCSGKKAYDKKGAQTVVNAMKRNQGIIFRAYHCPLCNKFHLTSKDHNGNKL